jgi:hypothetical protein
MSDFEDLEGVEKDIFSSSPGIPECNWADLVEEDEETHPELYVFSDLNNDSKKLESEKDNEDDGWTCIEKKKKKPVAYITRHKALLFEREHNITNLSKTLLSKESTKLQRAGFSFACVLSPQYSFAPQKELKYKESICLKIDNKWGDLAMYIK